MATIKEVAKLARVGTSTVSRYYNNSGYISEDARERIKKASEELSYRPNELARAMKLNHTYTIGLFIPTLSNQFFTELVVTIEQAFMQQGYKTVLCDTNGNLELEKRYIEMAISHRFDGIIFITGSTEFDDLKIDIPILMLDRIGNSTNPNTTVMSNHKQGTILGSIHLIECGCKNILYLTSKNVEDTARVRQKAFEEVMKENRISYEIHTLEGLSEEEINHLFNKDFDGVFAWNDITAIEFMSLCYARKIKIPDDIQLIGYDNIKMSERVYPKLTTISQPINELGTLASRELICLIEHPNESRRDIILDNTLIIRETTRSSE